MAKSSIKLDGKNIPLTKSGTPNLRYLTKDQKAVVQKYVGDKKKAKKDVVLRELESFLAELG